MPLLRCCGTCEAPPWSLANLGLQLGFLGAFGCELLDAGFSFAVDFGCEWRGFFFFEVGCRMGGWGPSNISFVVARMDCQSSNTVKGTSSRSQYVIRSEGRSISFVASCVYLGSLPWPFLANSKSVSLAAERSDTPSPA